MSVEQSFSYSVAPQIFLQPETFLFQLSLTTSRLLRLFTQILLLGLGGGEGRREGGREGGREGREGGKGGREGREGREGGKGGRESVEGRKIEDSCWTVKDTRPTMLAISISFSFASNALSSALFSLSSSSCAVTSSS